MYANPLWNFSITLKIVGGWWFSFWYAVFRLLVHMLPLRLTMATRNCRCEWDFRQTSMKITPNGFRIANNNNFLGSVARLSFSNIIIIIIGRLFVHQFDLNSYSYIVIWGKDRHESHCVMFLTHSFVDCHTIHTYVLNIYLKMILMMMMMSIVAVIGTVDYHDYFWRYI